MSVPKTYVTLEVLVALDGHPDDWSAYQQAVQRLNDGMTRDNIESWSIAPEGICDDADCDCKEEDTEDEAEPA